MRDDVSSAIERTSRQRPAREQRDGCDRPVRSDAHARHDAIARAIEIRDRRHHAEIDVAAREQLRADRRHDRSASVTTIGLTVEAVHERPDVQVARPRPGGRDGSRPRLEPAVALRPARRTPRESAARCLRAASGGGRGPSVSTAAHAVDVVGAVRDRHLRELRPVERPVHLDGRNRRGTSAAPPQSSARRRSRSTGVSCGSMRGSGANALKRAGLALDGRGALDERRAGRRARRDRRSWRARRRARRASTARTTSIALLGVAEPIERRLGDGLEPVRAQRAREVRERQMIAAGEREQIREREPRQRHARRRAPRPPAPARGASSTDAGRADEPHFARLAALRRRLRRRRRSQTRPNVTRSPCARLARRLAQHADADAGPAHASTRSASRARQRLAARGASPRDR